MGMSFNSMSDACLADGKAKAVFMSRFLYQKEPMRKAVAMVNIA